MDTVSKIEHSPLPWHLGYEDPRYVYCNNEKTCRSPPVAKCNLTHGLGDANLEDMANAAFIVRAVNAHDALLAACKWAATVIRPGSDLHNDMLSAIAKASPPPPEPPTPGEGEGGP